MFPFSYDFYYSCVNDFNFFLFCITCSLKDSQNVSMQSLPLHTSCLFSMLLNDDIVDIERLDGIWSPTFINLNK